MVFVTSLLTDSGHWVGRKCHVIKSSPDDDANVLFRSSSSSTPVLTTPVPAEKDLHLDAKATRVGTLFGLALIGRRNIAPVDGFFLARPGHANCPPAPRQRL